MVFVCPAQPELASPKARLAILSPPAKQHHFPGCSSGHHFLAQRASLPDEASLASADVPRRLASHFTSAGSLSSLVSEANLSTKLFLDCLCLLGAAGTGLAEGETGLCEAKTGHRR